MSDQDAGRTEEEMREHERQARERDPNERSADDTQDGGLTSGMSDGVGNDADDPDDASPPGPAANLGFSS